MKHIASLALLICIAGAPAVCQVGASVPSRWMALGKAYAPKLDHGHAWGADGTIDITSEFGLLLGAGPALTKYSYRADPYLYRTSLVGAVAIPSFRYGFVYTLFLPAVSNRLALEFKTGLSSAQVINFYGLGSDTERDPVKEEAEYYRVDGMVYAGIVYLAYGLTPDLWIGPALAMNYLQMYNNEGRLVSELDPATFGADRLYLGTGIQMYSDTREGSLYPRSGIYVFTGAYAWAPPDHGRRPYYQAEADTRWYATLERFEDVVLALRLGGMATFGEVPFYQSAKLGGRRSLRGYMFERFRGDHSVYGSAELRFPFFREVVVIPVEFGGFLMGDTGRLWYEGESPGGWRGTWGLGIWGATLSRDILGILYFAFSREGVQIRAGFGFDY